MNSCLFNTIAPSHYVALGPVAAVRPAFAALDGTRDP
jgi:hypothetical protein